MKVVESMSIEEAFKMLNAKPSAKHIVESKLDEAVSKSDIEDICGKISKYYGDVVMDSECADKILEACGKEPEGKEATLDEIMSMVQEVIASTPLAIGGLMTVIEAVFDVFMHLVAIGLIIIPVDGPVLEIIAEFIALIPISAIITALASIPASIANRIILIARKKLRQSDVAKLEKAVSKSQDVEEGIIGDTIRGAVNGFLGEEHQNEGIIGDTIRGAVNGFLGEDADTEDDDDDVEEGLIGDTIRGAVNGFLGR